MADLWSWLALPGGLALIGFHLFIVAMLLLDLGVVHRHAHAVSMTEAGIWSAVWVMLALVFAGGIWRYWGWWNPGHAAEGPQKAVEFVAGYVIEKSLSVDNLFVFLVIFRYFSVPAHLQHRVLVWGILGAMMLRAVLIVAGAALLHTFAWMGYVFGAFLVYTGYRIFRSAEGDVDPARNPLLRLARRLLPVVNDYESPRFWVRRGGRWFATPLPLVLLVVESSDVMFAIDSIPAIFAVTRDAFIVYTSNIFAILGLRALYFLLAGFLGRFRYLKAGLAGVLVLVGLKMVAEEAFGPYLESFGLRKEHWVWFSLASVAVILSVAVLASGWSSRGIALSHAAEDRVEKP